MKRSLLLMALIYLLPFAVLIPVIHMLFSGNYHDFTARLAALLQKPEWEPHIQNRFGTSSYLLARWIAILVFSLYFFAGFFIYIRRSGIIKNIDSGLAYIGNKWKEKRKDYFSMPAYARWLLVLLLVFVTIKAFWYILNWPLQYDEAWSYIYFIGNSLWQSFLVPYNNHIFFTIIAWFFQWIPTDPQISMRLPNLVAGLLLIVLFFFFIKKYVSLPAALFATAWLATCCPVVFYMLYARGYMFVLLFTLIALWSQILFINNHRKSFFGFILFTSLALGYWSNPVFLYPHAAAGLTGIWLILKQHNYLFLSKNLLLHLSAVMVVAILYLPTLLSSHIGDLVKAGTRDTISLSVLWKSFENNSWFNFGFTTGYIVLSLLTGLFVYTIIKNKQFYFLHAFAISGFIVIFLFAFFQSLPIAGHITIFFSLCIAVMIAIVFKAVEKFFTAAKPVYILLLLLAIVLNSVLAHRHHWFNWSLEYDKSAKKIAGLLIENKIQTCYLAVNYYKPHLEYYYKIKGKKIRISMPDSLSQDFRIFYPTEQQTVIVRNQGVTNLPLTEYRVLYKDEIITAFIRNDIMSLSPGNGN
jgi:hypothetical protein